MSKASPANNIVLFPPERVLHPKLAAINSRITPKSVEAIADVVKANKEAKINQIMEVLIPPIAHGLGQFGINIANPKEIKHSAFLIEALRSMIYAQLGLDHPLQKIANSVFDIKKDGSVSIVPQINVKNKVEKDKNNGNSKADIKDSE